ncbi:MAG: hypothetical protein M0Z28_27845 [Rhodospirillales bacterium]|nr:hypothetical protein [Rhodospirillales bacterium]
MTRLALGVVLGVAIGSQVWAQGMGPGMMGGNGSGMMGGQGRSSPEPGQGTLSDPAWDRLTSYVRSNRLSCMSCHSLSGSGAGPAFGDVARRFVGQRNGKTELANAIGNGIAGRWPGYPPMPAGLATPEEARTLAGLILRLAK